MELYRKIHIKSEADLPKEEGDYFVHVIKTGIDIMEWNISNYPDDTKLQNVDWLNTYDWYLQPIEISDADIEAWAEEEIPFTSSSTLNVQRMRWIQGAKSMRDGNLRCSDCHKVIE
jgi:type IV secretory pathway TrbF-like protein